MSGAATSVRLTSTKDASIETLRGLACILVVMAHSPGVGLVALEYADDPWRFGLDLLAYLRMPLFTFLSGYVYAIRPVATGASPIRFLRAKTRRLLLPMLVVGTVYILTVGLIPGWSTGGLRPLWVWHIIPVMHFWFIWAIFWCFLAIAFLDARGWLSRRAWMLTAIGAIFVASSLLPKGHYTPASILGALYLSLFFFAGIACRRFDWRGARRWWHALALGGFVLAFGTTVVLNVLGAPPSADGWFGNLAGVLFCLLLVLVRVSSRPLQWIGAHSYAIFLLHFFFIQGCRSLLDALGIHDVTFSILSTTIVALFGSIALERLFRMTRVTRFLILGQRWTPRSSTPAHSHGTSSPPPLNSARPHTERIGDP
ncbi:acyltransferase [Leifsonia shinshuensis]|uniref:acyltransferase family protein n=1 Tax=Leifsonia shinshuensis TaxID=150026 RepID=UPI002414F07C|nr:acyltransferase [Leifsonia shinshuensis]MCI0158713.1 acyltransferase [Leifsonia shinshuensis]